MRLWLRSHRNQRKQVAFSALVLSLVILLCLPIDAKAAAGSADSQLYKIPQGSVSAWIDVESTSVAKAGTSGSFGSQILEFSDTPSGVTAVIGVKELTGAQADLAITAKQETQALVAVTFVDQNYVVIATYSSSVTLLAGENTIPPGTFTDYGNLARTGLSGGLVLALILGGVALAGAGAWGYKGRLARIAATKSGK